MKKKKNSQYYSLIAIKELNHRSEKDEIQYTMVTYGDLDLMETLVDLFGIDRDALMKKYSNFYYHNVAFQRVMDRLDRESKKPDALFEKGYITYNGIINHPTRCFTIKDVLEVEK